MHVQSPPPLSWEKAGERAAGRDRTIPAGKTTREHVLKAQEAGAGEPGDWAPMPPRARSGQDTWGQATEPQQHQTPRIFHGRDGHGDRKSPVATSRGPRAALLEGPFYGGTACQGVRSQQTSKEMLRAGNWRQRLTIRVQAYEHSGQGWLSGMSGCRGQSCWPVTAHHYTRRARLLPFHNGCATHSHPARTIRSHCKALRV